MSAQYTPGPWAWFGNAKNREVYLATTHSGRRYVMGFQRWGMRGAQPMFQPAECGLVPAEKMLTFEVGDPSVRGVEQAKADNSVYRLDISGIDCADARLIAAAPELLEALLAEVEAQRLTDEHVEMIEYHTAHGMDDATGSSHCFSAASRADEAWANAHRLRDAAIRKATEAT